MTDEITPEDLAASVPEEYQELIKAPDPEDGSVIYQHSLAFYEMLESAANVENLKGNRTAKVFRGKMVEKFRELGISNSYYSPVRKALIDTGCMLQVKQGARGTLTIMVLFHPPVQEEVDRILKSDIENINLTSKVDPDTLRQRVDDLYERIGSIDLTSALLDFEKRIANFEKDFRDLKLEVDRLKNPMPVPRRRDSST